MLTEPPSEQLEVVASSKIENPCPTVKRLALRLGHLHRHFHERRQHHLGHQRQMVPRFTLRTYMTPSCPSAPSFPAGP